MPLQISYDADGYKQGDYDMSGAIAGVLVLGLLVVLLSLNSFRGGSGGA